ncbi:MAG: aspartyl/asparaginyl beta-hydroxylase domain-containing protein [Flavobacteriaceae bacterium]|nr:aspartyl/asparaginyl beta-hydroxylase domain-containing protein [Flavobacteriaceae bacterium]
MKYAQLPINFSEELLLNDLLICEQFKFSSHYNHNDYEGDWTSIALRSHDGTQESVQAFSEDHKFYDTNLLEKCDYLKQVVSTFKCEKESIRLLNLTAGSIIKEHSDPELGYSDGRFRIHIPITTNTKVSFVLDGDLLDMRVGSCWYGNFNLPHCVANKGKVDRVHLVIDCLRNDWSDEMFAEMGYDFELEKRSRQYSDETKQRIIEELKTHKTPESEALIRNILGKN